MPRIAISYRRIDSAGTTGRMFDELVARFGETNVFMDIDNVPLGIDYREHIRGVISTSDILLAVIGVHWLDRTNKKRLSDPTDLVRIEIQTALELGIPVIPVVVDYAKMPTAGGLPEPLKALAFRNNAEVEPGRDFRVHMDRLTRSIERLLAVPVKESLVEHPRDNSNQPVSANEATPGSPPELTDNMAQRLRLETSQGTAESTDRSHSPTARGRQLDESDSSLGLPGDVPAKPSDHQDPFDALAFEPASERADDAAQHLGIAAVRAALETASNAHVDVALDAQPDALNRSPVPAHERDPSDDERPIPINAAPQYDARDTRFGHAIPVALVPGYRAADPTAAESDPDSYYSDDGHVPPQEGVEIDRSRGGIIAIAATLGLVVIGAAGAFGYGIYTSNFGAPGNPPIIKADPTPLKTAPPASTANADSQSSKPFQDRIAAPAAAEQPAPRVTAPQPSAQASGPLVSSPSTQSVNEPRRVKTVRIGQDTPDTTAQQQVAAPSSGTQSQTPPAAVGAYVVQVSAQKTEAEAQSSYQALQAKYPTVLGGRNANIRRVDLGDKGGIFYRAQIGPFATSEQAFTFCNSLKDVGGQCIVQKN